MSELVYKKALGELEIIFRALTEDDAAVYRDIRLEALQTEGHLYTADIAEENARTLNQWVQFVAPTRQKVILGAFVGRDLIAATICEAVDVMTAASKAMIVVPNWRGKGIAQTLYIMSWEWCIEHGFENAYFTIRADNFRSRSIQENHGAQLIDIKETRFADGSAAATCVYIKPLTIDDGQPGFVESRKLLVA